MSRIVFSKAAEADLDAIDDYTLEHFGLQQAINLREKFQQTLRTLANAPHSAPTRPEYDPHGRSFRYHPISKRFVIVYEPMEGGIRVARVLNGARELASELDHDAGIE